MTLDSFIEAVSELVYEWNDSGREERLPPPRAALEHIYNKVREHAVHELAEAVRTHKPGT